MEFKQLCTIISGVLQEERMILPTDRLAEDLCLCSFDMMVIIAQIEEEYGCQLDVASVKKDMTVQELFSVVSSVGLEG